MNRGVWFAAGAAAGVYAMVRGRRAAEALTAEGLRDRWQALGLGARLVREEIAQGKAEMETELRRRIGERGELAPAERHGGAQAVRAMLSSSTPTHPIEKGQQ